MDKSSTTLSLRELRHLQWLLGCMLSCVSALVFLFLEVEAWGVLALVIGISLVSALVPRLPGRIPAWVRWIFLAAAVLVFGWDLFSVSGWLSAVTRLALLLLAYRGLGYRNRREELQGILLGLFLIVVAGVMTVSVGFVFLLILFTLCALCLLYVSALGDSLEPSPEKAEIPSWVGEASLPRLLRRLLRVLRPGVVLLSLGLLAALVTVSGFLFLVIPRFQIENSLFLEKLMTRRARSGFTDTVRYGEDVELVRDESVVLNIDIPEARPLKQVLYLRMIVLDEYVPKEGFRQSAAFRKQAFEEREQSSSLVRGNQKAVRSAEETWVFYLEPNLGKQVPLPNSFAFLRFRDPTTFRQARTAALILLHDEPQTMLAYQVAQPRDEDELSDPEFGRQLALGRSEVVKMSLKLPQDEASMTTLRQVAEQIRATAGGEDFSLAASRWMAAQHRYALVNHVAAGQGEALLRWLSSREPGHCELFAGALVLLCRSQGIPARLVVGFHGGQWNAYSNNLYVRNSDAHAWCEVWDGRAGWRRVDPTPGILEEKPQEALELRQSLRDDSWSARFSSYRVFWYRRVVNFDSQSQVAMMDAVRDGLLGFKRSLVSRLEHVASRVKGWVALVGVLASILASVGLLLLQVLLLLLLLWLYRRWKHGQQSHASKLPRVRREASEWLQRLKALGLSSEEAVYRRLERVRFGAQEAEPEAEALFKTAKREWKRRRREQRGSPAGRKT